MKIFFAKRVTPHNFVDHSLVRCIDPKTSAEYFELDGKRVKLFAVRGDK